MDSFTLQDESGATAPAAGTPPRLSGMTKRVKRGTTANILRQLSNVVCQLALVPVLLAYWGPEHYGKWQMLTAGAAYVALLNLGLQTYASNRMNQHYSRGEMRNFNEVFQSAFFFSLMIALVAIAGAAVFLFGSPVGHWVSFFRGENRYILLLLVAWHASSL